MEEEKKLNVTRVEMLQMLHTGIVKVEFLKKDGTPRVMRATLKAEHLPEPKDEKEEKRRTNEGGNPDLINVYDADVNDWRCFKLSSLTAEPAME